MLTVHRNLQKLTVIIRLSPGGLIQNSMLKRGLIREGGLFKTEEIENKILLFQNFIKITNLYYNLYIY